MTVAPNTVSIVPESAIAELQGFVQANIDPDLRVEITGKSVLSNKAVEEMAFSQLQVSLRSAAAAAPPAPTWRRGVLTTAA